MIRIGREAKNTSAVALLLGVGLMLALPPAGDAQPREKSNSSRGKSTDMAVTTSPDLPAATEVSGGREVGVTVYNDNLGVVKDRRRVSVPGGASEVRFPGVATMIDPTSVHLRPLGGRDLDVVWQDYRFDLLSTDKLLDRCLEQQVDVSTKDDQVRRGTLLSYDAASLVLRDASGGIVILNRAEVRQVALKDMPRGLTPRPTLVWRVQSPSSGEQPLEATYLTSGMSWHAEYVAQLDPGGTSLALQGWASVENRSGATYDDAKIKLVAGTIHRANQAPGPVPYAAAMAMERGVAKMEERPLSEYHVYELPIAATLQNDAVKQIGLLEANGVKATRKFTYDASKDAEHVMLSEEFENASSNNLGMPLPGGVVRVFQRDKDGSLELLGEDRIDHTAKNETVRVAVGGAFDIGVERKQTDLKQVTPRVNETAFEVTLRNHRPEAVDVTVVDHAYGDWDIVDSTIPVKKKDATTFEFTVHCSPEKPVTLSYRLRTRS